MFLLKSELFTLNRFAHRMAGSVPAVMLLLLLCLIRTGLCGESLTFAGKMYDVTFPCDKEVFCYDMWYFAAREIAIVLNGKMQKSKSQDDESKKCSLQIRNLFEEDHRCQKNPVPKAATELIAPPGETSSLQCVLLAYIDGGYCDPQVSLMWVDESGAPIHEDSRHEVEHRSSCEVTLTVTTQSPAKEKFGCQVTVGGKVQTSVERWVRNPAFKGRGRNVISDSEPEHQGLSDTARTAVGVVGCVVLTALVAAFAVKRTRGKNQEVPLDKSRNTISINHVPDDVIYADITLPISSDRACVRECEPTVYACVRY